MTTETGFMVLSFDVHKEIGQDGKNSQAYLAIDNQLNKEIVVKKILKETLADQNDLFKEARLLYECQHPNIVQIYHAGMDVEHVYFAMPYYKNGSIKARIDNKSLTLEDVVKYSIQFISGISKIHSLGLLHLDIKPDNILISDNNEAMISDFGLVDYSDDDGWYFISSLYIKHACPDLLDDTGMSMPINLQFDIYQIGLTMYRMLIGNEIFNSKFNELSKLSQGDISKLIRFIKSDLFPEKTMLDQKIPLKLSKIVKKCLSVNRDDRYCSTIDVLNDLSKISIDDL